MKINQALLAAITATCIALPGSWLAAQDKKEDGSTEVMKFVTPRDDTGKEWGGETIDLPPRFAPDMKVKGQELIRFAPGMFDAKSENFFSYIFAFSVEGEDVTEEVIHDEMLVYYRGLAGSLLERKGIEVDTDKFTFEMEKSEKAESPSPAAGDNAVTQYQGTLDWVEPFATTKPQKLHFELHAWTDPKVKRSYLVVGASPVPLEDDIEIWKLLREIRVKFAIDHK